MIVIRYSKASGIDVSGDAGELQDIRQGILALCSSSAEAKSFIANTEADASPYDVVLTRLVVSVGPGPTLVEVRQGEMRVMGDQSYLSRFAAFFDCPRDADATWHTHFEHYEGNRWVAKESESTTISLRRLTNS